MSRDRSKRKERAKKWGWLGIIFEIFLTGIEIFFEVLTDIDI